MRGSFPNITCMKPLFRDFSPGGLHRRGRKPSGIYHFPGAYHRRYAAQSVALCGAGRIYLYKGGTTGASNAGREPYCEYYASQVAETMGLNAVHYDLENWKGITASKCELFTNIDTAYIPIGRIVRTGGIAACLAWYDKLGAEFSEAASQYAGVRRADLQRGSAFWQLRRPAG